MKIEKKIICQQKLYISSVLFLYFFQEMVATAFVSIITVFLITYSFHCVWATSEAYSSPSIVLSARSHDGMLALVIYNVSYALLQSVLIYLSCHFDLMTLCWHSRFTIQAMLCYKASLIDLSFQCDISWRYVGAQDSQYELGFVAKRYQFICPVSVIHKPGVISWRYVGTCNFHFVVCFDAKRFYFICPLCAI